MYIEWVFCFSSFYIIIVIYLIFISTSYVVIPPPRPQIKQWDRLINQDCLCVFFFVFFPPPHLIAEIGYRVSWPPRCAPCKKLWSVHFAWETRCVICLHASSTNTDWTNTAWCVSWALLMSCSANYYCYFSYHRNMESHPLEDLMSVIS